METPNSPVALTEGSAEETFIIIFDLESIKNYTIYGMEAIFITVWKIPNSDLVHVIKESQNKLCLALRLSVQFLTYPNEEESKDHDCRWRHAVVQAIGLAGLRQVKYQLGNLYGPCILQKFRKI